MAAPEPRGLASFAWRSALLPGGIRDTFDKDSVKRLGTLMLEAGHPVTDRFGRPLTDAAGTRWPHWRISECCWWRPSL